MFTIGVTGGIGSGKTTVTDLFANLGIGVVDSDSVARQIVAPGEPCLKQIIDHFGVELLLANGALNRSKLRNIIFTHPDEKQWLEHITHPAIRRTTATLLKSITSPYAILSSPLLLETGQDKSVNRILVVDIPENIQVERASTRDEVPSDDIKAIITAQINRAERLAKADDIIDNSGSLESTQQQVNQLHQNYLSLI
ncbi:dephospho-CoA kinase [Teredinibacter purpureus]|uniref:dephospho-CoA kinase n=1 Tax=Teredinibacter purpureus TaxID=2731756 RepID=UPI0005F82359|nr:dephospho-CoA kinase [Teredinibacter purpureus]